MQHHTYNFILFLIVVGVFGVAVTPFVSTADTANSTSTASTTAVSASSSPADSIVGTSTLAQVTDATSTATSSDQLDVANATTSTTTTPTSTDDVTQNVNTTSSTSSPDVASATTTDEAQANINAGDANAEASVVNITNSTFANSYGMIEILSTLFGAVEEIDLREMLAATQPTDEGGSAPETTVTNENSATTTNRLVVRANSGGNSASTTGDGSIKTGNARAAANVVNVANTQLVDSQYLLLTFNAFEDWAGDLVLPGGQEFAELFSGTRGAANVVVDNNNRATVENNLDLSADTGNNSAEGDTTSVTTGSSSATANTINRVNQSHTQAPLFAVAIRVHGDWTGDMFSVPEGVQWTRTGDGLQLLLAPGALTGGAANNSSSRVQSTSTANVTNDVQVVALSGNNQLNASGTAAINTGNAQVSANVINVVNTTVYGQNMLLGILNIFGDWSGDVAFGRPDLWVGGWAEFDDPQLKPGAEMTLHYQIKNNGDTDATDVMLTSEIDNQYIEFIDEAGRAITGPLEITLDDIAAGDSITATTRARVATSTPSKREIVAQNSIAVESHEPDEADEDNTETLTLTVNDQTDLSSSGAVLIPDRYVKGASEDAPEMSQSVSDLEVEVSNNVGDSFTPPENLTYTVVVRNSDDTPAHGAELVSMFATSRNGEVSVINEERFEFGTIGAGEEITAQYTLQLPATLPAGLYTNTSVLEVENLDEPIRDSDSVTAVAANTDDGQVMGAATCEPLLTSYIRPGQQNDAQDVRRLQTFLRSEGFSTVEVTGQYDSTTEQAVRQFQSEHAADILLPWALEQPTGNVYYTTQQKINRMHCDRDDVFELTADQRHEISDYRVQLLQQ